MSQAFLAIAISSGGKKTLIIPSSYCCTIIVLPEYIQIDPWDGSIVTGNQLVSSCWHPEHQRLDSLDLAVVAVQSGKTSLPNLLQLGLREPGPWVITKFVEKPVSPLQPQKLISNDALESRTDQSISM